MFDSLICCCRKAEFKIVECIVSKDMRRLQVIWDCKPGRRDEVREIDHPICCVRQSGPYYFTRDLKILRQDVTRRAEYAFLLLALRLNPFWKFSIAYHAAQDEVVA